ncbi:DUF6056 family protein [Castellaniella caeni]|uniref:DUF6056 family protein n=1 Tax=Castellaniella caeni TaxID=266123 RepID=UPI0011AF0173|nr:DUF6056 family protein [Castellaniella caeni]
MLAALAILVVAFVLNHFTPMVSDDYAFYLMGVSWDTIKGMYMGWGGRLVANTLPNFILGLDQPWVADLFNSVALLALVWILTLLAVRILALLDAAHPAALSVWPDIRVLLLVFALYWIANPDLGQTTFWIVGAANYLWPSVFNFGFALAFVVLLQRKSCPWWQALLVCVLALPAGCSNENTGVVTWFLLACLAIRAWRQGQRSLWPWVWLFFMGVGICILVLAPGNYAREASFQGWYDHPFWWRVMDHFVRRFPDAMFRYWEVFLALGVLVYVLKRDVGASDTGQLKGTMTGMYLLLGMACLANAVLVLAPNIPKRALLGGFLYALLAFAMVAHRVFQSPRLAGAWWVTVLCVVCGVQWVLSFGLMLRAYHGTYLQDQVRVALVRQGIKDGAKHIEIPEYYFTWLLKSRDKFDVFFSGGDMARYYGGAGVSISEYPVKGPYGAGRAPVRKDQ